ncbi:MAG: metal-dependent transcriptional regulator [Methanomethylovorans sp.]|uniref:metal-dependent transcriptional regulator n=1 Tax=Methanomethylovorans sp. TaxID=2758717 RepID=UPI000A5B6B93|nr:metal-dependent transcriptional regulator [Methanomethylovorans sp.]
MITERTEDYLKAIEKIIEKKGYAQVKDVSRELDLSSPSVTGMFKKLAKMGYINYEKYGGVTLTAEGEKIAKKTMEKHSTIRDFLLIIGLGEAIANHDACRIEHILTPQTFDRLTKFVEYMNFNQELSLCLDHFKYFYETGKNIDCTLSSRGECPVHGKERKAAKK